MQKKLAESTENFVLCDVIHGSLAFTTEDFDSSCCHVRWLFLERCIEFEMNSRSGEDSCEE
jgi:hypothetical protein